MYVGFSSLNFLEHSVGDGVMKTNNEQIKAIRMFYVLILKSK